LGVKSPRRSGSQLALGGRVKSDRKRLARAVFAPIESVGVPKSGPI
jgi:hypothetical protein